MFRLESVSKMLTICSLASPVLYEPFPAAEPFDHYLHENASTKPSYENCNKEQQQEMAQRWSIFNKRYGNLSLENKKK